MQLLWLPRARRRSHYHRRSRSQASASGFVGKSVDCKRPRRLIGATERPNSELQTCSKDRSTRSTILLHQKPVTTWANHGCWDHHSTCTHCRAGHCALLATSSPRLRHTTALQEIRPTSSAGSRSWNPYTRSEGQQGCWVLSPVLVSSAFITLRRSPDPPRRLISPSLSTFEVTQGAVESGFYGPLSLISNARSRVL